MLFRSGDKGVSSAFLLEKHLKNILIDKNSVNILHEDIIAQKGMKYEDPNSLVLVGFTSSKDQENYFKLADAKIYHMPTSFPSGWTNTVKNLDKLKYFAPNIEDITEYYEISDINILPRNEIFPIDHILYKNSNESYYVFKIQNRNVLKNKILSAFGGNRVFRYAKLAELKSSKTINDFNN